MDDTNSFSSPTAYIRIDEGVFDEDGESIGSSSSSSAAYIDRFGGSTSADSRDAEAERIILASQARLRPVNLLNIAAYCANGVVSLGIGIWGFGGILPSVREVTKTHLVRTGSI